MATANHSANSATPAPLASNPVTNGTAPTDHYHHHDHRPAPTPASVANSSKKVKNKKAMDSSEASKLVAARISQLEVDNAAEKEQQEEIGMLHAFNYITRPLHGLRGIESREDIRHNRSIRAYNTTLLSPPNGAV